MAYQSQSRGFTLIETIVALIVVGLVLGGIYNAVSQQADERARLNDRFLGQTAAWNRLLDQYQLVEGWVPRGNQLGQRSGDTELYGRTWYWELETETTLGDNFYRYEVTTYLDSDAQDSQSVASLIAFYIVE